MYIYIYIILYTITDYNHFPVIITGGPIQTQKVFLLLGGIFISTATIEGSLHLVSLLLFLLLLYSSGIWSLETLALIHYRF